MYNPKVHKAPKKLRDGEWYPTTKDKLRPYEKEPRTIVFVPRIAPADKVNVVHIDPNERMFPTEHQYDPSRFLGTLMSAVDLVWFTEDDNESKSSYADWAGSIEELSTPEHGVHKYFSDIVPGYYVKVDSSETKKYAVLYVYRPFKSHDLEPEIMVLEIDEKEKFVEGASLKSIKCAQIIEVGGGNNSLCKRVVQWLKDNMGQFFNGCTMASATEDGQVDPAHVVEHMLGILDRDTIVKNYKEMSRKLADTYELADKEQNFMGVRKGRMEWQRDHEGEHGPEGAPRDREGADRRVQRGHGLRHLVQQTVAPRGRDPAVHHRVRRQAQVGPGQTPLLRRRAHRAAHTARGGPAQAPHEAELEDRQGVARLSLL